jgi:serine/threonine-protein kinase
LNILGRGARSTIYYANKKGTNEFYAVKVVRRETSEDDRFIEQAEIEYEVTHGIQHSNLRHAYQIHREKKWFKTVALFVVMDYIDGDTLDQVKPAGMSAQLRIFHAVAGGLAKLHDMGYIHADIKPGNIMIGKDKSIRVIDFGQCCMIGVRKDRIQGTPDFIAPEQVKKTNLDQRTDVYNLGATMYWCLTGSNYPTKLRTEESKRDLDVSREGGAPSPGKLNPRVPAALSRLVMDCCRRKPEDRPADMKEVQSRLYTIAAIRQKEKQADSRPNATPAAPAQASEQGDA